VASNPSGSVDIVDVRREQVPDIANLKDEENNPVDGYNNRVDGEGSVEVAVLAPDSSSSKDIIVGHVEGVVDAANDNKKPGDDGQEFVDPHGSRIVRFSLDERVDLMESVHGDRYIAFVFCN